MLSAKLLRHEIEEVARRLKLRGFNLPVSEIKQLEEQRKTLQVATQELQNKRNQRSKQIGQTKIIQTQVRCCKK